MFRQKKDIIMQPVMNPRYLKKDVNKVIAQLSPYKKFHDLRHTQ